jgi:hypothetical protein
MKFCQLSVKWRALPGLIDQVGGLRSIIRSGEPQMILGLASPGGSANLEHRKVPCRIRAVPPDTRAPHLSDRARADLAPSPRVSPERFEVLCHHATE